MRLLLKAKVKAPVSRTWLRGLASLVLRRVKGASFEGRCELSALFTGDGQMRRLNRAFRGKDKTTDVLSFPLLEGKRLAVGGKGTFPLGDVVVSLPQARRQAKARGVRVKDELALLLVHGVLHLLGYDHATKAQEKRMFGLQDQILRGFNRQDAKVAKKVK